MLIAAATLGAGLTFIIGIPARVGTVLIIGLILLVPDLDVAFLQEYPHFSVTRELGFAGSTDRHFVYAASIVEVMAMAAPVCRFLPYVDILQLWFPLNHGNLLFPVTSFLPALRYSHALSSFSRRTLCSLPTYAETALHSQLQTVAREDEYGCCSW